MSAEKLVITCGGTGGHFYPGLSVARTQLARGKKVLLLLSGKNSVEQSRIAAQYNIPCRVLPHMPSPAVRRPVSCWKFLKGLLSGIRQARQVLAAEKPDAVLGMGSFASLPVIWAAKQQRLPIVLHDGNARIGKANRWLSRYAEVLATAFPAVNASACCCQCVVSGMPLRSELKQESLSKAAAIGQLNNKFNTNLKSDNFTILLFGGSQGARKLNGCFGAAVRRLAAEKGNVQLIHLTGAGEYKTMSDFYADSTFPVLLLPTLSEMHWAYSAADLVLARSGGSSAAEINAFGKFAVVVPYPFAAELHQNDNADYLASLGAAKVVSNDDLSEGLAYDILQELYCRSDLQAVGAASRAAHAWDGAEELLKLIDQHCGAA
ncbi:MAG: UDP-N-acetylglucosamine--N-acetylmuramyl-(pentapeptide) pyrophosphoryl-undecaprenol N-acetylglucosamine transferase [Lentisphaerae bacterium]|nr:UDP-N-acetylglucosamine--N-acetylmuramyl-(pentapeptide) pyrophosphoryl-undecaprenol N-acetylglucosamine transferase [Lentisphaerota bacterium]